VQRLAKWTGGLAEVAADTDASGVADSVAGLGLANTDAWPLGDGDVAWIAAGDPLQLAVSRATASAPITASGTRGMAKVQR
jgi:hypothetical protein